MLVEPSGKTYNRFMPKLSKLAPVGLALLALAAGFLAIVYAPRLTSPSPANAGSVDDVDPAQVAALEAAWGIRITNVGVIASGGLIDFRFQVIDPDKALAIQDPESYPALVDETSGKVLDKSGAHGGHVGVFRAGHTYYLLYQNNSSLLQPGSRITIQIGDVLLENVLVR